MTPSERRARVVNLRRAARALADRAAALAPDLALTTRLSEEGVVFAFERSLEHRADDRDVEALVEGALRLGPPARRATVLLSANVFTAPFRALALACARADQVVVKPSRRDPRFTELLVTEAADPRISIESEVDVAAVSEGEVHAYGRKATLDAIRDLARVPVWAHGPGFGVGIVDGGDLASAAAALATDVVLFDQRGCMSPRIIGSIGSRATALRFAAALGEALQALTIAVPRGPFEDVERAAVERWLLTSSMLGEISRGAAHGIAVLDAGARWELPPEGRHVTVIAAPSKDAFYAELAAFAGAITNVGSAGGAAPPLPEVFAHARSSLLGAMQSIPFDGPVDRRALAFG